MNRRRLLDFDLKEKQQYQLFPVWDLLQVGWLSGLGEPVLQHKKILDCLVGGELLFYLLDVVLLVDTAAEIYEARTT